MNPRDNTNNATTTGHSLYLPHIDGIRAIAIIPVFLYHLYAQMCPGGFSGVDVFFVISGYLITGGIVRDLEKKTFTIKGFYFRRIRRIIPAYLFVLLGVFCTGLVLFPSPPLVFLSDAAVASSTFSSNIYFWAIGGDYFAPRTHSSPLLHLWSLGVEEQFYLFIPIICITAWRITKKHLFVVFTCLTAASLMAALKSVSIGQNNEAFYLPHLRAWELLAGSLLSLLPAAGQGYKSWTRAILGTVGFLIVLTWYYVISSETMFPGVTAIPPVVGTILLIRYGNAGVIRKILTLPAMVNTGRISYSLYLWHWPVIVFWKYAVFDQFMIFDYIGIVTLSFGLSYLSWKFVEMPVRSSSKFTISRAYALAICGCIALFAIGLSCSHYRGWPTIFHQKANEWAGSPDPLALLEGKLMGAIRTVDSKLGGKPGFLHTIGQARQKQIFEWGGPADMRIGQGTQGGVFLLGDSHAGSLQYGLNIVLCEANLSGYVMSQGATPMFDLRNPMAKRAMERIQNDQSIKVIVLCQNWLGYSSGHGGFFRNSEEMTEALANFSEVVAKLDKRLLILECIPTHKYPLNDIASRLHTRTPRIMQPEWLSLHQTTDAYNQMQGFINAMLRNVAEKTGAKCIPIQYSLLDDDGFRYFWFFATKVTPLYKDTSHLTPCGSRLAAEYLYHQYLQSEFGALIFNSKAIQ